MKIKYLWACSDCPGKHHVFSRGKKMVGSLELKKFCIYCKSHKIHRRTSAK